MIDKPLISICIPAYQRVNYLKRLLDSIAIQSFKDFEVVITDDSGDDSVKELHQQYTSLFAVTYQKNVTALGTPENWNEAQRLAKGEWIKIMHDDDWFAGENSLAKFAALIDAKRAASFVFSGSNAVRNNEIFGRVQVSKWQLSLLKKDPANLYYYNFIGPPSVTAYKNGGNIWYDNKMKWQVDADFYIRFLQQVKVFSYTTEPLINIGYSESQVTESVFKNKDVVVKESLMLMEKLPHSILKRIWNYDFTWRLMRNYRIRSINELEQVYPEKASALPDYYKDIVSFQEFIPGGVLRIGVFSKLLMCLSYIISRMKR